MTSAILRFIVRARTLGLTLSEIKGILDLHRHGMAPCEQVTALLDKHIRDIDRAIADLHALRTILAAALQTARIDQRRGQAATVSRSFSRSPARRSTGRSRAGGRTTGTSIHSTAR
ncbi:MerR family DNA-binding protein [Mycobacterium sp. SM1]|uniref:MerR family DNA-binding protein n=1 Tax=Mycobacterium sp. SM1 TaxID=2816243 RepID=UPI001F249094|nr:MerR family DNA-binding protein [Mycobacterium sp. SM1]